MAKPFKQLRGGMSKPAQKRAAAKTGMLLLKDNERAAIKHLNITAKQWEATPRAVRNAIVNRMYDDFIGVDDYDD